MAGDHDMPKKPKPDDPRRVPHLGCRPVIGFAWLRVPARMVVGDGEGTSVVAEHRVENLPNRHERAVDGPLRDDHGSPEPVCCVTHAHEATLASQAAQSQTCNHSHIARTPQYKWRVVETESSAQLKRGHDRRRLGRTNAEA